MPECCPNNSMDDPIIDGLSRLTEEEAKMLALYSEAYRESDGFDVPYIPRVSSVFGLTQPLDLDILGDILDLKCYARLGIEHYKRQPQGTSLVLVDVVKAMIKYPGNLYITFTAKDTCTGQIGTYQTLVVTQCPDEASYVDFTRVKPESQSRAAAGGPSGTNQVRREREAQEEEKEGKRCMCHCKAVQQSNGFDVPYLPVSIPKYGLIKRLDLEKGAGYIEDFRRYADLGIAHFNQQEEEGTNLELMDIVKVVMQLAAPFLFYNITFTAKDTCKDHIRTCQTKVALRCRDYETHLEFTRAEPEIQSRAAGPLGRTKGRERKAQEEEEEEGRTKCHCKAFQESEGFDGPYFPVATLEHGLIMRLDLEKGEGDIEEFKRCANLGIARYNQQEEGTSLELVDIVKVVIELAAPFLLYNITFTAKDTCKGQIGTYQTKAGLRCSDEEAYVEFTRVKPKIQSRG